MTLTDEDDVEVQDPDHWVDCSGPDDTPPRMDDPLSYYWKLRRRIDEGLAPPP